MEWKEFLKPDWRKILIFVVLMGVLNYLIISTTVILDARILVGIPFGFWPIGSFMMWPDATTPPTVEFSWINFIIDVIFWYLLSCLIIWTYYKVKK